MKRVFLFFMVTLLAWSAAMAVPAKRGFVTLEQSDGTTIDVEMRGDEFHHSFVTRDGLTVARDDKGDFYYRTVAGTSAVRAHNEGERSSSEQAYINTQRANLSLGAVATPANLKRARRAQAMRRATQVPTSGTPRVPIIIVEYSDKKVSHTLDEFKAQYTSGETSAYQYFYDQSNGKYQPQFDVFGVYTLSSTRKTYGANDSDGNDKGLGTMVSEAVELAHNAGVDFSPYDNDGDGEVDVVIVVYAGVGEAQASTTVPESIWPCQWDLTSAAYYNYGGDGAVTYNNVTINKFAVFNEITGSSDSGTTMDGVGTFCHEYSHCLGLPDFYVTDYQASNFGMGAWSLMNYGCYNNSGNTPVGYCAYEKAFMNWISYIEPTPNTQYTLGVFNSGSEATDQAVKITSDVCSNEYYILENRAKQGWDAYIGDEGLLVTHICYVADRWDENTVNNESVELVDIVAADNTWSSSTLSGDCYPNGSLDSLTDNSTPATTLNLLSTGKVASKTGGAGYLGKPVTEMTLNSDGTASFWYIKSAAGALGTPYLHPADTNYVTTSSFKAEWDAVTDATNYTLYVNRVDEEEVSTEPIITETFTKSTSTSDGNTDISSQLDTYADNSGWTGSKVYTRANGGVKLGASKYAGYITSPELDLSKSNGKVTIVFSGYYYNTDGSSVVVSCGDNSTTQALTSSEASYTVVLDCEAATGQTVKFATTAQKKRVYLTKVEIYSGDVSSALSSMPRRAVEETGDATTRTITGIEATNYTVENLTAGETYEFKVKAYDADGNESEWSNIEKVTLKTEETTTPELITLADTLDFGTLTVGEDSVMKLGILGANLTSDVTLALTDANSVFTINPTTFTAAQAIEGVEDTVTFAPTAAGEFTATVAVTCADVDTTIVVTLIGKAETPVATLIASPDAIDFGTLTVGEDSTINLSILGENLTSDVTLALTDENSVFTLASTTLTAAQAIEGVDDAVTFTPTAAGEYTGTVTITCPDVDTTIVITLQGKAEEPVPVVEEVYVKVTDESSLAAGDSILIVYEDGSLAMSTTQNKNNRGQTSVTISDETITLTNENTVVQRIVLEGESGAWQFHAVNGDSQGYLNATNKTSSNVLHTTTATDAYSVATIAFSDGDATITFTGKESRNLLQYNKNNSIFSCYNSGQQAVQIYAKQRPVTADTVTLAEALAGEENTTYVISNDLYIAKTTDSDQALWCTDGDDNWVKVASSDYATLKDANKLAGKSIKGTMSNLTTNPVLTLSETPTTVEATEFTDFASYSVTTNFAAAKPDEVANYTGYYFVENGTPKLRGYGGTNTNHKGQSLVIDFTYVGDVEIVEGNCYTMLCVTQINEAWETSENAPKRVSSSGDDYFTNYTAYPLSAPEAVTALNELALPTGVVLNGNTLTGSATTRVYTLMGHQLPSNGGQWTLASGYYIVVDGSTALKIYIP